MSEMVSIRRDPTAADLSALQSVAKQTVLDIAKMDGALGHDAISLLYVERLYHAIVARAVKPKAKGKKR